MDVAALVIKEKKKKLKTFTNRRWVKLWYSPSKEYYATIQNYKDHTTVCKMHIIHQMEKQETKFYVHNKTNYKKKGYPYRLASNEMHQNKNGCIESGE